MRPIGFSTGAISRGDFRHALDVLARYDTQVVELSALRIAELEPLVAALPDIDLGRFSFVSVHAPSRFSRTMEQTVIDRLRSVVERGYPIVIHPDVMYTPEIWHELGGDLLIENMDKRKPVGRSVQELRSFFDVIPQARLCFDIGHARQFDPSMTEASLLLAAFADRLAEVHISEVNTASRHDPISANAVAAFRTVAARIPENVPIVLETLIDEGQSDVPTQIRQAREALGELSVAAA